MVAMVTGRGGGFCPLASVFVHSRAAGGRVVQRLPASFKATSRVRRLEPSGFKRSSMCSSVKPAECAPPPPSCGKGVICPPPSATPWLVGGAFVSFHCRSLDVSGFLMAGRQHCKRPWCRVVNLQVQLLLWFSLCGRVLKQGTGGPAAGCIAAL